MSRTINRLTARQVEKLVTTGRHSDGGNLYLSISKNGGKRWVFFYRFNGKQREMGLGSATTSGVSLAKARELASQARSSLQSGKDPLEVKKQLLSVRHYPEHPISRQKARRYCPLRPIITPTVARAIESSAFSQLQDDSSFRA